MGANGTRIVDVWADVVCPFTHVGLHRFVERRDAVGSPVRVRVHAWPLERVNGAPLQADVVAVEVAALRRDVAPDRFLGFRPDSFPSTSIPAFALTALAYEQDLALGERVAIAVRDAVFEEGRDVGRSDVIAELAAAHGLDPDRLDPAVVDADHEAGRRAGVVGSPFFVVDGAGFFCPALRIQHVGDDFDVEADVAAFEEFAARALA